MIVCLLFLNIRFGSVSFLLSRSLRTCPTPPQAVKTRSSKRPGMMVSLLRLTSHHPHTSKVDTESDVASSIRVGMLSRSMRQNSTSTAATTKDRDNGLASSASSVRSVV